jgi:hypothetical protein
MHPAPLVVMDYVGPALGALLFVAVMSLIAEPTRRTRKLPRQVDSAKRDWPVDEGLGRNVSGGTRPRLS